jgi:hypothetical protein
MKRRDYRTELKQMNKEQLERYVNYNINLMNKVGEDSGSTSLLTKIVYAKSLLSKMK